MIRQTAFGLFATKIISYVNSKGGIVNVLSSAKRVIGSIMEKLDLYRWKQKGMRVNWLSIMTVLIVVLFVINTLCIGILAVDSIMKLVGV